MGGNSKKNWARSVVQSVKNLNIWKKVSHSGNEKGINGLDSSLSVQDDQVALILPGLTITLTRKLNIDVPHEVSIYVPRAEVKVGDAGSELVYSSITVVHAPRHPLSGEKLPGAEVGKPFSKVSKNHSKGSGRPSENSPEIIRHDDSHIEIRYPGSGVSK